MPRRPGFDSHRPFEILKDLIGEGRVRLAPETDKPVGELSSVDGSLSDEEAFQQAMADVRALGWSRTPLRLPRPIEIKGRADDESEALARLKALLVGEGELDPFATGEGVEGAATPRGRFYLKQLKMGDFSVQAHLDLHRLDLTEAQARVEEFIRESSRQGYGCVRIIHGRGKHSATEPATLKTHLTRWLATRKMSRFIVAFASARWKDGGSGAVYVLLYRKHRPPRP